MAEQDTTLKSKKIFFDLEMTGLHKLSTPISLGLVSEDGREYYAEFTDFDKFQVDNFLRENVLSKRVLSEYHFEQHYDPNAKTVVVKGDIVRVYATLMEWLKPYKEEKVEFWGDAISYDWVLFVSIFGNGLSMPEFIDPIPMDLCTALRLCGEDKDTDRIAFAYGEEKADSERLNSNNALFEAATYLEIYKKLMEKMSKAGNPSLESEESEEDEQVNAYNENFPPEKGTPEYEEWVKENPETNKDSASKNEEKKPAKKPAKKRGRPKKQKEEVSSDVNAPKVDFVEPSQADVNSTEEWNPPV